LLNYYYKKYTVIPRLSCSELVDMFKGENIKNQNPDHVRFLPSFSDSMNVPHKDLVYTDAEECIVMIDAYG